MIKLSEVVFLVNAAIIIIIGVGSSFILMSMILPFGVGPVIFVLAEFAVILFFRWGDNKLHSQPEEVEFHQEGFEEVKVKK